jgi:hypothetical protein
MDSRRYLIFDENGVLWLDDGYDAFETGSALMAAVEHGPRTELVSEHLGHSWRGDLVFAHEISRTR